jgi:beta-lactamase class A
VELLRDYFDVETPEDPDTSLVDQVEAWKASGAEEDGPEETRARFQRLLNDPRDQGTPMAMASLLRDLWKGELLSAEHTALLKEIMRRCRTGSTRLSGGLPDHVLPIAHKTGTLGGSVNDVGVVALPDGGDLVIAVFVQGDAAEISRSSLIGARAIAQITRAVYDYFLLAAD